MPRNNKAKIHSGAYHKGWFTLIAFKTTQCGGSVVVALLFIVSPIVGVCSHSSFAINLMGRKSWLLCFVCLSIDL